MSLKPYPIQSVPAETARVARAAFPHGSPYLVHGNQSCQNGPHAQTRHPDK
jgi:hypothetical protein